MKIERIDHLNLTVADIDRSMEFFRRVLGMTPLEYRSGTGSTSGAPSHGVSVGVGPT